MEEKIIITALMVRDKDGKLLILDHPTLLGKGKYSWFTADDALVDKDNVRAILHRSYLPQIKWEDEKPTKVELTIKICE